MCALSQECILKGWVKKFYDTQKPELKPWVMVYICDIYV